VGERERERERQGGGESFRFLSRLGKGRTRQRKSSKKKRERDREKALVLFERTHASACGRVPAVRNISATLGRPMVEAQSSSPFEPAEADEEAEAEEAELLAAARGLQIPAGGPPPSRSDQSLPHRIHWEGSEQPSPQPESSEEVPSRTWTRESWRSCFFFVGGGGGEVEREG